MKKQYYIIYAECIKENSSITSKFGEIQQLGKIKSEGLAYITCKAIQDTMKDYFKVYYK